MRKLATMALLIVGLAGCATSGDGLTLEVTYGFHAVLDTTKNVVIEQPAPEPTPETEGDVR